MRPGKGESKAESRHHGPRRPFVRRRKRPRVQMGLRAAGSVPGTGGRAVLRHGLMSNYAAGPSPASGEAVRSALSAGDDVGEQEDRRTHGNLSLPNRADENTPD